MKKDELIEKIADERHELMMRVSELEEERLRFYHADGTFEVLASPEEVVKRRVECVARVAELEATNALLTKGGAIRDRNCDRYREALERILNVPVSLNEAQEKDRIARNALK